MIIRPGPVARQPVSAVSLGRCGHGGQGQSDMSWGSRDIGGLAGSCGVTTWGWGLGDPVSVGFWHGHSFLTQVQGTKEPHLTCLPRVPVAGLSVVWATKKLTELPSLRSESRLSLHTSMDGELVPFRGQIFMEYLLYAGHWGSRTEQSGKKFLTSWT